MADTVLRPGVSGSFRLYESGAVAGCGEHGE